MSASAPSHIATCLYRQVRNTSVGLCVYIFTNISVMLHFLPTSTGATKQLWPYDD